MNASERAVIRTWYGTRIAYLIHHKFRIFLHVNDNKVPIKGRLPLFFWSEIPLKKGWYWIDKDAELTNQNEK